jgi:hypothetical protein
MQQANWRYCSRCQGLFYAGLQTTTGACPAGGGHDYSPFSGTGTFIPNYTLQKDDPGAPGQSNWRWCNKCQGLSFAGNFTSGTCPAGGGHNYSGSSDYTLSTSPGDEPLWMWCKKCQGLVTFKNVPFPGPCPAGGDHDISQSLTYTLDFAS